MLERLERMYFEPDGSFVWTGEFDAAEANDVAAGTTWQVDGVLYDRGGRLAYVEIKGGAPLDVLKRLLAAFGWPDTRLTFQLVREGIVLEEEAFWAWLAGASPRT